MLDPDAPNATSTLINGVSIIIDMIRHNNSDLENDPGAVAVYEFSQRTSVSLAGMLQVMGDHVAEFTHLLLKPRSVNGPIRTTMGELEPLGFERLKICELFAELLHCSNMSNLNKFNVGDDSPIEEDKEVEDIEKVVEDEKTVEKTEAVSKKEEKEEHVAVKEEELSVGDHLKSKFVENKAMPICVVSSGELSILLFTKPNIRIYSLLSPGITSCIMSFMICFIKYLMEEWMLVITVI